MNKVFLHVDLDAFFASVEQLDHPEYRGKPVIVGGLPGDRRSVVSTASYEARKYGVHSAMPTFQAVKLCPEGIFVRVRMKRYHEMSEKVMSIFKEYSPDIQQISVDEAFVDLTGTERLFGDPVETAKKLKAEILEKTGLTVSVGLASTKYCAKIASGLQKPDGLTVVPFGGETDFMLSLPIEKVWGAGSKTLEKLKNYGIKTTRDIYIRSENLLKSLFGNATGTFLYNAVRGNEGLDFHAEPKNRSISAETTYEYDLTNPEIIETALLDLCHTVMFRSLREKVRSCSVSIKIRYEDFSTVSVQGTSERYVSSVDDLFERAKSLLEKKRDPKLGIRLLGVAMQNLEDESSPRQQELFDFGDEKKRRLETAILKAQEKNPSLKITKARLLGTTSLVLALFALTPSDARAEAPEIAKLSSDTEKEADGAGSIVFDTSRLPLSDSGDFVSFFNRDFGDQNVEFFAEGYWKSTVTGGAAYTFGFGTTPALSTSTPVFAQNVDLSLYFMLNHHWYFEAAFADEFSKNTIAAGYIGDGYLKSARISNRKIIFPSIYSVDEVNRGIGGGENQAPGISLNWKGENWRSDAVARYDMIEAHQKTWYGKNSVSVEEISLSSWNTGNQYILPGASLVQKVKAVYVESSSGSLRDSKGRKYKKLDESQYLLLASENQILLSKDARAFRQGGALPAVSVTFYGSVSQNDFDDYLSRLKKWFGETENGKLKLENYFYTLFNSIDGEDCLFLQHPSGFSPFAVASRYDCGSSSATDSQVAFSSTGSADSRYTSVIDEDKYSFASKDFFYSNHLYADISLTDDDATDEIDRLIHASFPLAAENPQIYLGGSSSKTEEKVLQVRTFTPVSRFEIGTNAVPGTITVYKNGIIDSAAKYDGESGTITLSSGTAASDHITARWYEESEDSDSGSFSLAAGFKYDFSDRLSADISSSSRWGYSPDKEFADSSSSQTGYATLAGNVSYAGERFSLSNTAAATYENINTSGNYRILGNDDSEGETCYLSKKAAVELPEDFAPVLNEKTISGTSQIELNSRMNGSVEASEGKSDSKISGYAIPLEWNFSGIETESANDPAWSAVSLYTPGLNPNLANASVFEIALKNPAPEEDFDTALSALYLQLGVSAEKDFTLEESERIPAWKISDANAVQVQQAFDFKKSGWQTVKVTLSDEDRSRISSLQDFNVRLILTAEDVSVLPSSGTIFAGPYEAGELSFAVKSTSGAQTSNYQTTDSTLTSSKVKKFNRNNPSVKNHVQFFEWNLQETEEISFTRYFSEIDLSEYKKLSFFLKAKDAEAVEITLTRPESNGEKTALKYRIEKPAPEWTEYEIDLKKGSGSNISILNTNIIPSKIEIKVFAKSDGTLAFDELFLSDTTPYVIVEDKIKSGYKIDGTIIGTENFDILKDLNLTASGRAADSIETENGTSKENYLESTGALEFTLTKLKISTDASFSNAYKSEKSTDSSQKNPLASSSYKVETDSPFLDIISLSDSYTFSASESSLEKYSGAKIDFSSVSIPLSISAGTKAGSDLWSLSQDAAGKAEVKAGRFSFQAEAKAAQKIPVNSSSSSGKERLETENYGSSWKKITALSFDTGDEQASKRNIASNVKAVWQFDTLSLKPALFWKTDGSYKNTSKTTFTDSSEAGFEIPFSIPKNNFSFSWKKQGGSSGKTKQGGSYARDTEELRNALSEKSYFLTSVPVYDLASGSLASKVLKTESDSNFYTGSYVFTWKRAFLASRYDFFIPNSTKLEASRDIRTGTSTSDFYQIKGTTSYTAMNIFGRSGTFPLFSIFTNDSYNSSFTAAVKIPRASPSSLSYLVNGYVQATMFFTPQDYLKNGFEGSFEGKNDWKAKYTLVWKRNSDSSLARGIVSIFSPEKAEKVQKITKTDSLNAGAGCTSSTTKNTRRYSVEYAHATETQVSKYIYLNTEAGLGYQTLWGKSAALTANATLGATIKF